MAGNQRPARRKRPDAVRRALQKKAFDRFIRLTIRKTCRDKNSISMQQADDSPVTTDSTLVSQASYTVLVIAFAVSFSLS